MARQHRFVENMHARGSLQGKDFHNSGPSLERVAFWSGVSAGAVCGVLVILSAVGLL